MPLVRVIAFAWPSSSYKSNVFSPTYYIDNLKYAILDGDVSAYSDS